ncbi:MAG: protein kinase [Proteobacteria bacterium]|nr:protein kinase [Pseudomonadota bacterium]
MAPLPTLSLIAERFRVEQVIGEGGMGRVWRATDTHTGERVAVKELTAISEPTAAARFLREAGLLASVSHPGIVRYVGHGKWESTTYLAMEWLHGETLSEYLVPLRIPRTEKAPQDSTTTATLPAAIELEADAEPDCISTRLHAPLSVSQVVAMGARLAAAVVELHQHGIIHRDIKPSNLFLVNADLTQVKLIDLGVARSFTPGDKTITNSGVIVGTPHYMAPEQAQAAAKITPAVDVWAIGSVLYQCLTGFRPFDGHDVLSVLTNILLSEPLGVAKRQADIPSDLADIIMRTLHKEASGRPTAAELAEALDGISSAHGDESVTTHSGAGKSKRVLDRTELITDAERRILCALIVTGARELDEGADDRTIADVTELASIRQLVDGTRLVTFSGTSAVLSDQASQAARTAITLRKQMPGASMAVVMCATSEGSVPVGSVVKNAADKLRGVTPGTILLDKMASALLEARFLLKRSHLGPMLLGERSRETARTVLGKQSPWVGRRREISWLVSALDECIEDSVARAVLVTGPAGMGKSRLWQELLNRLEQSGDEYEALCGRGDAFRIGSPFVILATAVNAWAELDPRDSPEMQWDDLQARLAEVADPAQVDRLTVGLSVMLGTSGPRRDHPMLAAARENPVFLRQLMEEAWLGWLRALTDRVPVLLILDDLHWGDQLSVTYVDVALRELGDRPLMVLALARPDLEKQFPNLWSKRGLSEFPLHPLSSNACAKYVSTLLSTDTDSDVLDRVVQRSGGNAFCLEELVRAVAAGASELPDTVLGTVQARLDSLGSEAKRVLRAASVFGMEFAEDGVAALVSRRVGHFHVDEWLSFLVQEEVVEKNARSHLPDQTEYIFCHALMRDAAYALLTDDDLKRAHHQAGAWLADAGEPSPLVLAEHFVRGGADDRAAFYLVEAANVALNAGDLGGTIKHGARAIELGATGELRGRARALMSVASDWQSEYHKSQEYGLAALEELDSGASLWFVALGSVLMSSARIPDQARVGELIERLQRTSAAPDAEKERLSCLCRVGFGMMMWADAEGLSNIRGEIETAVSSLGGLPPQLEAQYQEFEAWHSVMTGDLVDALNRFHDSAAAYEESGMLHNAINVSGQMAYMHIMLGEFERARELCDSLMAKCEPSNVLTRRYLRMLASVARCRSQNVPGDQAVNALYEVIEEYRQTGSQALMAVMWTYTAEAEYARSNFLEARTLAQRASEVHAGGRMGPWVSAVYALALVGCGELDRAREQADRAVTQKSEFGGTLQGHLTVYWAQVEVREALGDREGAARALRSALDELARMRELAGTDRAPSLMRLRESKRFLRLAESWEITHK